MKIRQKRILSILLLIALVLSMLPGGYAQAAGDISVSIRFQDTNIFLTQGEEILVSPGLSEAYGYTLGSNVVSGEVTALDALVALHIEMMGTDDVTEINDALEVSSNGFVTKLFGDAVTAIGCFHNGTYPHGAVSTSDPNEYEGYTISEIVIVDGDTLDFFLYQDDSFYSDYYTWFEVAGNPAKEITVETGEPLQLTLRGYMAMAAYYIESILETLTEEIEGATVGLVASDGSITPFSNAVTTNEDGVAEIIFDTAGTYTLSAFMDNGTDYIVSPLMTVTVEEAQETAPVVLPELPAEWVSARGNRENMGLTSAATPRTVSEAETRWANKYGSTSFATPNTPAIVDDCLIFSAGKEIFKVNKETGDVLAQTTMVAAPSFGITSVTYGGGMVFAPVSNGRIQAFSADTLESLWVSEPMGGQSLSPIVYHEGYVYTGFWSGENKDNYYVCIDVTDTDPSDPVEEKIVKWKHKVLGGFYWAGGVVFGDYILIGTDNGTTVKEDPSSLLALDLKTGAVIDELGGLIGDQRSSIALDKETGNIYFTTKAGYICSAHFDPDTGRFDSLNMQQLNTNWECTGTPVLYEDTLFIGTGAGVGGAGKLCAVDAATLSLKDSVDVPAYPQGSPLVSDAYVQSEGKLYTYITYNGRPGGITVASYDIASETLEVDDLYIPETAKQQYCIDSVICDTDGTLYYHNDSSYLFAVEKQGTALSDAVDFDPQTDLSFTDVNGNALTPTYNAAEDRWEIRLLEGGFEQKLVNVTLEQRPNNVAVSNLPDVGDTWQVEISSYQIEQVRPESVQNFTIVITSESGLQTKQLSLQLIRPALEAKNETEASSLYRLNGSLYKSSGDWLPADFYTVAADGSKGTKLGEDLLLLGETVDEVLLLPRDESAVSAIGQFTLGAEPYVGTLTAAVDGNTITGDIYAGLRNHVHTALSTYGPDNKPCTKIVYTCMPPVGSGYTQSREYTIIVPFEAPTDLTMKKIAFQDARSYDRAGQSLLDPGTNAPVTFSNDRLSYQLSVDYDMAQIYMTAISQHTATQATYRLNGSAVTPTKSIEENGLDGVFPLVVGSNTLEVTYTLSSSSATKTFTFQINRSVNCNADFDFTDGIEAIGNQNLGERDAFSIGYPTGVSQFTLTVTARETGREIQVSQDGSVLQTGVDTISALVKTDKKFTVVITDPSTGNTKTYTISPYAFADLGPTKTYALMPAPGQFLNESWSGFDSVRVVDAIGTPSGSNAGGSGGGSLGNFGGYVTYYFEDPIQNASNNKYGADFVVYGNAFSGNNEPGAIKVAKDNGDGTPEKDADGNEIWYDLAGSMHYEDSTIWDYSVTYENPNPDFVPYVGEDIPYTDSLGNSGVSPRYNAYHAQIYYPDAKNYVYDGNHAAYDPNRLTFTGVRLDAENEGGRAIPVHFGYTDTVETRMPAGATVQTGNPYHYDHNYHDLDWAVDENGKPVSLDEVSFVKIYTATLYDKDATGEMSTEVMGIQRADKAGGADVGRTHAPDEIILKSGGFDDIVLTGSEIPGHGETKKISIGDRNLVRAVVKDSDGENIFINNAIVQSGADSAPSITVDNAGNRLIRIIVQSGEQQAYICLLELESDAEASLFTEIKAFCGVNAIALNANGRNSYRASVPNSYSEISIKPTAAAGAVIEVNGNALDNGQAVVALTAGADNRITLTAQKGSHTETVIVSIYRESASTSRPEEIPGFGEVVGKINLTVENNLYDDGAFKGVFIKELNFKIAQDDTMMTAVLRALKKNGYGWTGSGGVNGGTNDYTITYLSSVTKNGKSLGEFDGTSGSGWMGILNDWFVNESLQNFVPVDGDQVAVEFTLDYGNDLNGAWGDTDTSLASLKFSTGVLSPSFDSATNEYTLKLTKASTSLKVTPTAANRNFLVKMFKNEKVTTNTEGANFYKRTQSIPVVNGDIIYIGVGESAWPSMEDGSATPTWYKVTIEAPGNGNNSNGNTGSTEGGHTELALDVKTNGNTMTAAPDTKTINSLVKTAKEKSKDGTYTVALEFPEDKNDKVTQYDISLSKDVVSALSSGTVAVKTPIGIISLPDSFMKKLAKEKQELRLEIQKGSLIAKIWLDTKEIQPREYGETVTIQMPYALSKGENQKLVVLQRMTDENVTILSSQYANGYVSATVKETGRFEVAYKKAAFHDVTGLWMEDAVLYMSARGIVNGITQESFAPDQNITRAEFSALMVRMLQAMEVALPPKGSSSFSDVSSDIWYYDTVEMAKSAGFIGGYPDGTFRPDETISREDMFLILYRGLEQYDLIPQQKGTSATCSDVNEISSYAADAIQALLAAGLIQGSDGKVMPQGLATRAESAQLLYNIAAKL